MSVECLIYTYIYFVVLVGLPRMSLNPFQCGFRNLKEYEIQLVAMHPPLFSFQVVFSFQF